jgi:ubiquinone/menaquinone biosynthesis C-methylase UbiE
VIPWLGRIAQRNAECYRWLAVYTEDFATRDQFAQRLRETGLRCEQKALFFGCARLYVARK